MNAPQVLRYVVFMGVILLCVKPVGLYLHRVFEGQRTPLDPILRPIERLVYRAAGINPQHEMNWKQYALAFVVFSVLATLVLFVILLLQPLFPWHYPTYHTTLMTVDLALNTVTTSNGATGP